MNQATILYHELMAKESSQTIVHRPRRRPSLRDLAANLGVSHTAVARALNGEPGLSDRLRDRIVRFARREGYVFNDVTQSLLSGQTATVGVIVPRLASPFIDLLVSGIADALWEHETVPLVLNSQLDPDREEAMLKILSTKRVDALIIMPCVADRSEDHFVHLIKQHTPIVALDNAITNVAAPLVGSDDELGGEMAARHLIELGHRHIAHIGVALEVGEAAMGRERGYERALRNAGLEPSVLRLPQRALLADSVLPALEQWMESPSGRKATAVFAFNDSVAWCIYTIARRMGIQIGDDLAVIGYGNTRTMHGGIPEAIDLLKPTLSSVEQHAAQWGRKAVAIARRMANGEPVALKTQLEPNLVIRESSGLGV